jgi:hypothetical protein
MEIVGYLAIPLTLIAAALIALRRRDRGRRFDGAPVSDRAIENARRQAGSGHSAADQARMRHPGNP